MDSNTEQNRLVHSCIHQKPFAWQQFVDAYLPVVLQTIHEIDVQTSQSWSESQHHELSRMVFLRLRDDGFQLLRDWNDSVNKDRENDFSTYLIIVTRRIVLNQATADQSSD